VNLLPGFLIIALGLGTIALVVVQRARRPVPVPVLAPGRCGCGKPNCAHGVLPAGLAAAAAGAELVEPAPPAELTARVTRSCVSVYRGHGPDIRLVAVWRWSRSARCLVAYDRLDPEWSPEWSRSIAASAWEAR
jgi:hypothetical protein